MLKILICNTHGTKKFSLAAVKFLSTFTMARDYPLQLMSYDECLACVEINMLTYSRYWFPTKGHYAIVTSETCFKYTKTIELMRQAYSDFSSGWRACRGKLY